MTTWKALAPGECIALFTAVGEPAPATGLHLRWTWREKGGLEPRVRGLLRGFEVEEAFETCIDIAEDYMGSSPHGLTLHEADLGLLERHQYVLRGGSLGLALLLGLLGLCSRRAWPAGYVAWGGLRPVRDGTFVVCPVDEVGGKVAYARELGARVIVHPAAEPLPVAEPMAAIGVDAPVAAAVPQLLALLERGDALVH